VQENGALGAGRSSFAQAFRPHYLRPASCNLLLPMTYDLLLPTTYDLLSATCDLCLLYPGRGVAIMRHPWTHPRTNPGRRELLPPPIVVPVHPASLDALLEKEWLLTNRLGAYASSTVIGCNTRRYHALLVAATNPPVGRLAASRSSWRTWKPAGRSSSWAANEFSGAFAPRGFDFLVEFRNDVCPRSSTAAAGWNWSRRSRWPTPPARSPSATRCGAGRPP